MILVASCIPFSFFAPCDNYACHACLCHLLAFYASLHACLHIHAWVLLASVLSILQHNEVVDIQSKSTFVPREHHLLFAFLLVCLLACLLAILFLCLLHLYACLLHTNCALSTHLFLSIACLLVSYLCFCMYTHGAGTHGARAWSPWCKQKGRGCKLANMSQVAMFSRFRVSLFPLVMYSFKPLPSSSFSPLDGLY